ncbi:MAG: 30S ribosome-binding factor RbfA [Clostridia bacterium]|jgi:ribosome-binding factor A|nr:30S ribosome-binding factor RbfA [Clostridia bacterium]MBQ2249781.1 30S ribosome-binding factor RbfA [Clostridia bacterium]MBQ5612311.1 30S ribosome-binding factor RbfA [Clostridia bacterium]MBQ5661561.1 30S ribosome-binding factor RbfA [Clostridia bacterium]MBQ5772731.1 30S ribosome-binding factor RbfA [Clostridia bacterium]
MAKYRRGRINDEMQKEMTSILRRVKDPRISDSFVSITAVDCTADLKYAKIYYSALRGDAKEVAAGLRAAGGFIRRELARTLNLRITPELTFLPDTSIAYGAHIASILETLDISEEPEENDGEDGEDA